MHMFSLTLISNSSVQSHTQASDVGRALQEHDMRGVKFLILYKYLVLRCCKNGISHDQEP